MIILIHEFGYQSVKTFVETIRKNENLKVIIHTYKKKTFPSYIDTIELDDFSIENIVEAVENISKNISNENVGCVTFDENLVELCGILNDRNSRSNKKCLSAVTSYLLTDKLLMRSFLGNIVPEPNFSEYTGKENAKKFLKTNLNGIVLKPRALYSSRGQYYVNKESDLNHIPISLNNYLMEEKVNYTSMYTSDGLYTNGNIFVTIHQYGEKISDSEKNTAPLKVKTADLYEKDPKLIKKIEKMAKNILINVSTNAEVIPFHFEWFVDTKKRTIKFCEGAARFGGAYIPELIMAEYNVDVKQMYAKLLTSSTDAIILGNLKLRNRLTSISFSPRFSSLNQKKLINNMLDFPNWILFKKSYLDNRKVIITEENWMTIQAYTVVFNYSSQLDLEKKEKILLNLLKPNKI